MHYFVTNSNKISRAEAIKMARETLLHAEEERSKAAEAEAKGYVDDDDALDVMEKAYFFFQRLREAKPNLWIEEMSYGSSSAVDFEAAEELEKQLEKILVEHGRPVKP